MGYPGPPFAVIDAQGNVIKNQRIVPASFFDE
jgi:hypothetical protein